MIKVTHKTLNIDFVVKGPFDALSDNDIIECFDSPRASKPRKFLKSFLVVTPGDLPQRKQKQTKKEKIAEIELPINVIEEAEETPAQHLERLKLAALEPNLKRFESKSDIWTRQHAKVNHGLNPNPEKNIEILSKLKKYK